MESFRPSLSLSVTVVAPLLSTASSSTREEKEKFVYQNLENQEEKETFS